jgi:hypothetical protein
MFPWCNKREIKNTPQNIIVGRSILNYPNGDMNNECQLSSHRIFLNSFNLIAPNWNDYYKQG